MTAAEDNTGNTPPGGYRALLRLPIPRRLALMALPADFADWVDYAAVIALLVFTWGEGPYVLAIFAICLGLPYVLVGPLLAVVVDRSPLRLVLILSNLGRGLATFALVFVNDTALVLAIVFIRASINSAFTPARQAAIQATTQPPLLGVANGLHHAINQTSKIAGPAVGGLLLAIMSARGVFGINAALSLIAAGLAATIPIGRTAAADSLEGFRKKALAGLAEFRRSRLLRTALIFSAAAYFAFFLYDALIALLADDFDLDATAFGLGISASGAGGLIGALVAGSVAKTQPLGAMAASALVGGLTAVLAGIAALSGWPVPLVLFLFGLAFAGGSTAFMTVPYRTIVQSETPPDRIARVFATGEAVTMTAMLLAPFLGSAVATGFGTGAAFAAGGVVLLALGSMTLARRRAIERS